MGKLPPCFSMLKWDIFRNSFVIKACQVLPEVIFGKNRCLLYVMILHDTVFYTTCIGMSGKLILKFFC